MKHTINYEKLLQAISITDCSDSTTLLETLWTTYSELYPISSSEITDNDCELDIIMDKLPNESSNKLFTLLGDFCYIHEHAAFIAGLKVGANLMLSLADLK